MVAKLGAGGVHHEAEVEAGNLDECQARPHHGCVPHLRGAFPPEFVRTWTTRLHLFEVRTLLEPELAGLAARRATADQLTKIREVLDAQAAQVQRGATGMEEDVIFHRLIAEATGNPALVQVMDTLSQVLQETRDASLQHNGRALRSLSQNQAILAAIEARNAALAIRRMRAHIRSLERVLFATGVQTRQEVAFRTLQWRRVALYVRPSNARLGRNLHLLDIIEGLTNRGDHLCHIVLHRSSGGPLTDMCTK